MENNQNENFKSIEDMTLEEIAALDPEAVMTQGMGLLQQVTDRIAKIMFLMNQEQAVLETGFEVYNNKTKVDDKYRYQIIIKGGRQSCLVM